MQFRPVTSLGDALRVRTLRNTCRASMTNDTGQIGLLRQIRWYFRTYRQARQTGRYRLYLLSDDNRASVGYGALHLDGAALYITECVGTEHGGRGHGKTILHNLIDIARSEQRDLIAEIWSDNRRSIALHEKRGFVLESRRTKAGKELRVYRLPLSTAAAARA